MEKKKKNIMLFVTAAILLVVISNATYAYFAARVDIEDNLLITANFSEPTIAFTSSVEGDSNMTVTATDLLTPSVNAVKSSNGSIVINLLSGTEGQMAKCTYDIVWQWTGDDYYISSSAGTLPYVDSTGTYNYEYSITGSRVTENDSSNAVYENKDLLETDLSSLSWNTSEQETFATIIEGAEIYNNSENVMTTTTWSFDFKFYSLPVSQHGLLGKNLNGKLVIRNVVC